jgi:L-serine deaminase
MGKIKNLYVSVNGNIAIQLDNGFPNSASGGQCATANINSFGGNVTADPAFKSALLAAKAAQQSISVTVQGCEASGAWFKIIDVYIN